MSVLITGGAGFIGSHVTERLVEMDYPVSILDNLSSGAIANIKGINPKVEFIRGSHGDRELVRESLIGVDLVIHLAASPGSRTGEDLWQVLEANNYFNHIFFEEVSHSKVKKLLFASSAGVYGEPVQVPVVEGQALGYNTPYQVSKRLSEVYCQVLYTQFGIDTCTFRFFNVYGPRQAISYGPVIPSFFQSARKGEPLIIYGDGTQTRDFVYISDVVDACILAINKETRGEIFNIATENEASINELAAKIIEVTNRDLKIIHRNTNREEIKRSYADISKAKAYLGYAPKIGIDEGLRRTWKWLIEESEKPTGQ